VNLNIIRNDALNTDLHISKIFLQPIFLCFWSWISSFNWKKPTTERPDWNKKKRNEIELKKNRNVELNRE